VLRFFGLVSARSPIGVIGVPILTLTEPVVAPFQEFLPTVRVLGGVLEVYTLVAMVAIYLLAGLIGQLFVSNSSARRPGGRYA
jgi:uncharacterized protein YggT (Ycf19 family)